MSYILVVEKNVIFIQKYNVNFSHVEFPNILVHRFLTFIDLSIRMFLMEFNAVEGLKEKKKFPQLNKCQKLSIHTYTHAHTHTYTKKRASISYC